MDGVLGWNGMEFTIQRRKQLVNSLVSRECWSNNITLVVFKEIDKITTEQPLKNRLGGNLLGKNTKFQVNVLKLHMYGGKSSPDVTPRKINGEKMIMNNTKVQTNQSEQCIVVLVRFRKRRSLGTGAAHLEHHHISSSQSEKP